MAKHQASWAKAAVGRRIATADALKVFVGLHEIIERGTFLC